MKYIFYTLFSLLVFISCKTSKDYLSKSGDDKTIFDALKTLKKHNNDTSALHALPVLYNLAQQRNLRKINSYSSSNDLSRWDKMIDGYTILQEIYQAIIENDAASTVVNPVNYQLNIYDLKKQAAADYYNEGLYMLSLSGRANAKKAYSYFQKTEKYIPNFEDAKQKKDEAFNNAIVNVVINPVHDNSYFFNSGWGNYGYNYSNQYFQQTLIRDLGGINSSRYPARFYSDWEARRDNVHPDWEVNLTLRNMYLPRPQSNTYNRNTNARVEIGRDTLGKPVYQTVYATLHISRLYFTARADMEVSITELATRKNIAYNTYRQDYNWQEEQATYTGDRRALSASDWTLINNSRFNEPTKEDVLNELYRGLYPQVKNRVTNAVDW